MRLGKAEWKTMCDFMLGNTYVHKELGTVRVVSVSPETEEGVLVCSVLSCEYRQRIKPLSRFMDECEKVPVVSFEEMFGGEG
jgi:hypothetical protein